MSEFRLNAGSVCLVTNCADELSDQATWLLESIRALYGPSLVVGHAIRIQFGWTLLTLKPRNGDVVVCEPDYAADAFRDSVEDVTRTLWVQAQQCDLLRQLGLDAHVARFRDKVVIARSCLEERRVFLQRQRVEEAGDSGWFIGSVQEHTDSESNYESLYVYQVLIRRPSLLRVMSLPPDYVAVFDDDHLESILDPQDRHIWPPNTGGGVE